MTQYTNNAGEVPSATSTMSPHDLCDFPRQAQVFQPLNVAEQQTLTNSIQTDGMRDPIHVLPPNNAAGFEAYVILDGHSRRDAAIALGWDAVPVLIRHDLVDADDREVTRAFLSYNFTRRQLDPLDQAVVLVEYYNAGARRPLSLSDNRGVKEVEEQLSGLINKSGKTARRYVKIALLPTVIVQAVQLGRLHVDVAPKICTERDERQEEIADAVEDALDTDADINNLVGEMLNNRSSLPTARRLRPDLEKALDAVADFSDRHGDNIFQMRHPGWRHTHEQRVADAIEVLTRVKRQIESINLTADDDAIITDLEGCND